jgi:hypothetical protein
VKHPVFPGLGELMERELTRFEDEDAIAKSGGRTPRPATQRYRRLCRRPFVR